MEIEIHVVHYLVISTVMLFAVSTDSLPAKLAGFADFGRIDA